MRRACFLWLFFLAACVGPGADDPAPGLDSVTDVPVEATSAADTTPDTAPPDPGDWERFERTFTHPTRLDSLPDRPVQDLGGTWLFATDPDEKGLGQGWYAPDSDRTDWREAPVPGVWNMLDEELFRYKGVAWHARTFDREIPSPHVYLEVGACFRDCRYWLNGAELGTCQRGYSPVRFEVGEHLLDEGNVLVVRIDNRITTTSIPAAKPDEADDPSHGWYPYGGIHRAIRLVGTGATRVVWVHALPEGETAETATIPLAVGIRRLESSPFLVSSTARHGDQERAGILLLDDDITFWRTSLPWSGGTWDPDDPRTGTVTLTLGGEQVEIITGFRTLTAEPDGLHLNGKRRYLYGISRHEDLPETGPVHDEAQLDQDRDLLVELGVNFIRPGHYPADPRLLDRLRDAGVMVVEEIPVYQLEPSQLSNGAMLNLARQEMSALVERDRNNPAIVAWSLMNEVASYEPSAGPFAEALASHTRILDPGRLLFYADQTVPTVLMPADYVAEHVDIVGLNCYHGWYFGDPWGAGADIETMMDRHPDRLFVVSEFGAGAGHGIHLDEAWEPAPEDTGDHSYSEEFQAWFLEQHLGVYAGLDLVGVMPWAFADFRMEWTTPTGNAPAPFMNFKGLLSHDRQKKLSFETIKTWYTGDLLSE